MRGIALPPLVPIALCLPPSFWIYNNIKFENAKLHETYDSWKKSILVLNFIFNGRLEVTYQSLKLSSGLGSTCTRVDYTLPEWITAHDFVGCRFFLGFTIGVGVFDKLLVNIYFSFLSLWWLPFGPFSDTPRRHSNHIARSVFYSTSSALEHS